MMPLQLLQLRESITCKPSWHQKQQSAGHKVTAGCPHACLLSLNHVLKCISRCTQARLQDAMVLLSTLVALGGSPSMIHEPVTHLFLHVPYKVTLVSNMR